MAIATLLGLQDKLRRVRNSHRRTISGNRWSTDGEFVPSNIDGARPVAFCWDNNDLQEVKPSGDRTTHCTNGIVIQRRSPAEIEFFICQRTTDAHAHFSSETATSPSVYPVHSSTRAALHGWITCWSCTWRAPGLSC